MKVSEQIVGSLSATAQSTAHQNLPPEEGMCRVAVSRGLAEGVGFEPTRQENPPSGFRDRRLQPLGHPSASPASSIVALPQGSAQVSAPPPARGGSSLRELWAGASKIGKILPMNENRGILERVPSG